MIEQVIDREGGFIDHPDDRGGATKFGVTRHSLSRWRGKPVGRENIEQLTRSEAHEIYRAHYFDQPGLGALPPPLQPLLLDCAVHHGPARAIMFLQSCLNEADFGPLTEDGVLGPQTLAAAIKGDRVMTCWLVAAIIQERRTFMRAIVARDQSQSVFLNGWMKRTRDFFPQGAAGNAIV